MEYEFVVIVQKTHKYYEFLCSEDGSQPSDIPNTRKILEIPTY